MWFSIVCALINNEYALSQCSNGVESRGAASQQILTTVMMRIAVDKSTDNAKPHSICFLPQYQHQSKCLFFSERKVERKLKMALCDTLTCATLSVLLLTMAN